MKGLPHAYVVGADGLIVWHGSTYNEGFLDAVGQVSQDVGCTVVNKKKKKQG